MMHKDIDELIFWMAMDASALEWPEEREQLEGIVFKPSLRYRLSTRAMLRDPLKWCRNRMRTTGQRVLRAVASFLLAVTILFAAVMTVCPTARAMVKQWLMEWYERCVVYSFTEDVMQGDPRDYELTYVPEGYVEIDRLNGTIRKIHLYQNKDGDLLRFTYQKMECGNSSSLWTDSVQAKIIKIQGCPGEMLISTDASTVNTLVWHNTECSLQFSIHGFLDENTLIAVAESVKAL